MFNKFFSLFSHDVGIDLGTANTLVWVRGKGVVIREPSVVAMHKKSKKVIAIGTEAKKMIGKTPPSIITIRPLKGGVISDFDATTAMIAHYIQQVHEVGTHFRFALARPKVVIGIPSAVTEVERRAVWEAALSAGAREAYLIEEPMAAAIGEGVSVFAPTGVMVVDIGGGTTEVAIISLNGVVYAASVRIGGDRFDESIINYVRRNYGSLIGETTAERIKQTIGTAFPSSDVKEMEVRGRNLAEGVPRSFTLNSNEILEAMQEPLSGIVGAVRAALEQAPPELASDIAERGMVLTGGGALLRDLDRLLMEETGLPVVVAEDPLTCVARGGGRALEIMNTLGTNFLYRE